MIVMMRIEMTMMTMKKVIMMIQCLLTHYLDHNGAAARRFLSVLGVAIDVREMRTAALRRQFVAGYRMMRCHKLFDTCTRIWPPHH